MVLVKRVSIKNLTSLLNHVGRKFSIKEGEHAILPDNSEVCIWEVYRGEALVGKIIAHYVDNHYLALIKLPKTATDRDVIDALLREREVKWLVSVEDVLVIGHKPLHDLISSYVDTELSSEASEALNHYVRNYGGKVIDEILSRVVGNVK
ncbi:MAG: hypothetical protein DRO18_04050 [Thermoprotei archaeon]|nr:MAG: hypothetical protein DRO18_04050 [Thermoprotei archaeon]